MEGGENRTPFLEDFHVLDVVVRCPIFPASEEDPNPFEGQGTNDGVKFFTFGRVVIDIIASPLTGGYGEASKFMEGLSVKLGAGPAEVNHSAFAAAFGYRTDSAKGLRVFGLLVTGAIGSKE